MENFQTRTAGCPAAAAAAATEVTVAIADIAILDSLIII
jgi:hypothetical protein